ncbi:hypothetical protein JCM1841_003190 [Sporobolomyces salmonicolor]
MSSESLSRVPLLSNRDAATVDLTLQSLAQAYGALQAGKLPTSHQFVAFLQKTLHSSVLQPDVGSMFAGKVGGGKLSKRGREVVVDTRKVLEALARLVLQHNDDDKIQRFIWQAKNADVGVDVDVKEFNVEVPDIPVPSRRELSEASQSLHQLLSLLLTSNELRYLLADSINLFRDLFADAAENVADVAIQATRASKKAARKARPSDKEREEKKLPTDGYEHWEDVVAAGQDVRKNIKRGAEDKRDEMLKQGVKELRKAKEYIEEELPTDAKDAVIERFKAIINEIQSQPEYSEAVNTLSHLARKYFELSKESLVDAAQASTAKLDGDLEPNAEAQNAVSLLRQIVESFTGSLEPALQTGDKLYNHVKGDERIQQCWKEFDQLVERCINDPGYITTSKASRRFDTIYDRAREIVESNAEWKRDANAFITETQKLLSHAANDKALLAVGDACEKLGESLADFAHTGVNLVGVDGGDLWKDVSQVFLPRLLGALKQVPLPRVEYTSEDLDLIVDNIRFESASFIPDAAHFKTNLDYSTKKGYAAYASEFSTHTTLSFAGLRMQATNISYYVAKKTGWIGLEDSGLLDVYIGSQDPKADDGLDVTLILENAHDADRESFFRLKKVEVNIEGFDIGIRQSSHPIRNWLARGALRSYMEVKVKEVLEEQIAAGFQQLDQQLFLLQYKATAARTAAPDPLAFLRAIFAPTSSGSLVDEITSTGITKVGPKGEYILAIGVEEELLPNRLTGLGKYGKDVVGKKRAVESLMEEGRAELGEAIGATGESVEDLERAGRDVGEALDDEARKLQRAKERQRKEEGRRDGWKSEAFDFVA